MMVFFGSTFLFSKRKVEKKGGIPPFNHCYLSLLLQLYPFGTGFMAVHAGVNETDALEAHVYGGIAVLFLVHFFARNLIAKGGGEGSIDIRVRFKEPFGMAARQPAVFSRRR